MPAFLHHAEFGPEIPEIDAGAVDTTGAGPVQPVPPRVNWPGRVNVGPDGCERRPGRL